jgi:nickel/cobalt transporter (NiCoT) family protein
MNSTHTPTRKCQPERLTRRPVVAMSLFIGALHLVGWVTWIAIVIPQHVAVGAKAFGLGIGVTAYVFGLRHAFDADHIAAIDNTTRRLMTRGQRPHSVGFWFSLGHASVVFALALVIAVGVRSLPGQALSEHSSLRHDLSMIGTTVSGGFLYIVALLNAVVFVGIWRLFRRMRNGDYDEARLEAHLNNRGLVSRIVRRLDRSVEKPWHMYVVGLLFGLGFDTATEVALLVLAGTGAASGLPWYAIMVLPLLFACGMSLLDCLDGLFISVAYDWAFLNPVRKVYYNISITGLSVAVAFLVGTIELVSVLHDNAGWVNPVTTWISGIDLNNVGFIVVGLFVATWAVALGHWRIAKIEGR